MLKPSVGVLALVSCLVSSGPVAAQEPVPESLPPPAPAPAPTPAEPPPPAPPATPSVENKAPEANPTAPPDAAPAAPAKKPDNAIDESWAPALFGDPTPFTRRPPTNRHFTFESSFKFGLVGTGPTRFVTDFRFAILDWLEVRTQLGPVILPESLMFRLSVGRYRQFGRFGIEGGLHKFDVGARIFPDAGEERGLNPDVIPSVNLAGALTYDLPIWDRFSIHASLRVQQRVQQSFQDVIGLRFMNPLDQFSAQAALQGSWDVTKSLGMTVGVAYGQAIENAVVNGIIGRATKGTLPWNDEALPFINPDRVRRTRDPLTIIDTRGQCGENKTRTLWIDFAELNRPGFSTLVDREQNCSLNLMGALTYGRTEAFDVDLFGNVRMWPTLGALFGAGVRWRIAP